MGATKEKGVDLDDRLQREWFLLRLDACEYANVRARLNDHEVEFVRDMRYRFDTRGQDAEFGLSPWNPSRKQYNHLDGIYQRVKL